MAYLKPPLQLVISLPRVLTKGTKIKIKNPDLNNLRVKVRSANTQRLLRKRGWNLKRTKVVTKAFN